VNAYPALPIEGEWSDLTELTTAPQSARKTSGADRSFFEVGFDAIDPFPAQRFANRHAVSFEY
jgi:hypothetical protein